MSRRSSKARLEPPRVTVSVNGKDVAWGKGSRGSSVTVSLSCPREDDVANTGLRAFFLAEKIQADREAARARASRPEGLGRAASGEATRTGGGAAPRPYAVGAKARYSERNGSVTPAQKKRLQDLWEKDGLVLDDTWASGLSEAQAAEEIKKRNPQRGKRA